MPQVNIGPLAQIIFWIAIIAVPAIWMALPRNEVMVQRAAPATSWTLTIATGFVVGLLLMGAMLEHGPANRVTLPIAFLGGIAIVVLIRRAWSSVGRFFMASGCFLAALFISSIGCELNTGRDLGLCQLAKLATIVYNAFAGVAGIQ